MTDERRNEKTHIRRHRRSVQRLGLSRAEAPPLGRPKSQLLLGHPAYGCTTPSSFIMAGEGGAPGATGKRTLTSSQAWEGTEAIQVLGHLLPQVFEGAETGGQGGD